MSVYRLPTTDMFNVGAENFNSFNVGDEIITLGYYAVDDGGGARFRVEQGLAASGSYFQYTLVNTADNQLKAVMIIEDGTVNIDQLGAKGDAVLPASYNDTIGSVDSCNVRTTKTLNINNGSTEYLDENEVAITATDNADYFNKAISNEQVHCVRLTAGKIYGTKSTINMQSDKVLDGNGATIMNIEATPESNYFYLINCRYHDVTKVVFFDNIEIKNVRLIHNSLFGNNRTYRAIYIQHCRNVDIHDVTIERSHVGIKTTATNKGVDYNTISIRNVHISDVYMGLEIGDIMNSSVTDSYISCDYNLLLTPKEANGKHCIYADGAMKDCVFRNLTLLNAGKGNAINRNTADNVLDYDEVSENKYPFVPSYTKSEDIVIENIIIDNCDTAIHLGKLAERITVKNVIATNLDESGLTLTGIKDVLIENCYFKGRDESDGAYAINIPSNSVTSKKYDANGTVEESTTYYDTYNYYVNNVVIKNCSFDFHRHFIGTAPTRETETDDLTVINCQFYIHDLAIAYADDNSCMPSQIKGTLNNARFKNCRFEYTPTGEITQDVQRNGAFFYLMSNRGKKMKWQFENCSFINNGSETINSPIMDRYIGDLIYITVTNCTIKGFRFVLRRSIPNIPNEEKYYSLDGTIDPAWQGIPNDIQIDDAVFKLNDKKRFLLLDNIYFRTHLDGLCAYFKKTEEYGVS